MSTQGASTIPVALKTDNHLFNYAPKRDSGRSCSRVSDGGRRTHAEDMLDSRDFTSRSGPPGPSIRPACYPWGFHGSFRPSGLPDLFGCQGPMTEVTPLDAHDQDGCQVGVLNRGGK